MLRKVTIAIISTLICCITQAAPSPKVQDVNIVEIAGIITPSMIPVDVMNKVTVDNPTFTPAEIRETMVSADGGQGAIISDAQVIREFVVIPSPGITAADGCKLEVFLDDHPVSIGSWNGDRYSSFQLQAVGPIDIMAGTAIKAVLTPLPAGTNGTCSADLAVFGIVMPNN